MSHGDIAIVLGTRPEAIKLFLLIRELGDRSRIVHTGQHFDDSLASRVNADLDMRAPDVQLDVGGRSRAEQVASGLAALSRLFAGDPPSVVVVQGDTNAALAGGLAANAA